MEKDKKKYCDKLTEKTHSEFTISKQKELEIKVMPAKQDMKKFHYSLAQVCELYGLSEEEIGIIEGS